MRALALALLLAATTVGCDGESPAPAPATAAAVGQPASLAVSELAVSEVASWPVDAGRLRMLGLGPTYVVWAAARDGRSQAGPTRVVVSDLDGGTRRTVYRSTYAGGQIGGVAEMAGRVLVVDERPGPSDHGPPTAWRLMAVGLAGGRRVLAESEPGVVSWSPAPVTADGAGGWTAGWVQQDAEPPTGAVAFTWMPGSDPRRWGSVGRAQLVGLTADGLLLERIGRDEVRGMYRIDLALRTRSGVRRLTDDGLVVEADVDGSTLAWSERADRGHQLADPVEVHTLDLDHLDGPETIRRGATGWELHAGDGFVLRSGRHLGLSVAPAQGGTPLRLPGARVPGTSNSPAVLADRVAYVRRTDDGVRLVVLEVAETADVG